MKGPKCALFYERRSGNNWYKRKNDRQPVIEIQGEKIETYKRSQAYKYLGKSLSICGEDPKQVEAFIEEFKAGRYFPRDRMTIGHRKSQERHFSHRKF